MSVFSRLLIIGYVLLSALVRADKAQNKVPQEDSAIIARRGAPWDAQLFLKNESEQTYQMPFNRLLDSRSLLESWMGKRQETCVNSGYSPCTGTLFLHPFTRHFSNKSQMETAAVPPSVLAAAHSDVAQQAKTAAPIPTLALIQATSAAREIILAPADGTVAQGGHAIRRVGSVAAQGTTAQQAIFAYS